MGYCKMTLTLDSDLDFIYHERLELYANYDRDRNYSKKKFISSFLLVWGRKHGNHYSLIYLYNLYNSAQVYLMKFKYMVHE